MISSRSAVASKIGAGDDAYKQVHDALLEFGGEPTEVTLRRLSDSLGLDTDAVFAEMGSDAVTQQIAQTRALAQKLNISGTPTFVLGTELLRGYLPADQMELIAQEVRERG